MLGHPAPDPAAAAAAQLGHPQAAAVGAAEGAVGCNCCHRGAGSTAGCHVQLGLTLREVHLQQQVRQHHHHQQHPAAVADVAVGGWSK